MKNKTKYSLSSAVFALVAVAIIIVVNVLVTTLGKRVNLDFDMTPNKIYELTDTTKDFLQTYDIDTTIYMFASEANEDSVISNIISNYDSESSYISVQNINPVENPTFGREFVDEGSSLQSDSVIISGANGRFRVYTLTDLYNISTSTGSVNGVQAENRITSALQYIQSDQESTVYVVTGHNELELEGARTYLEDEGYIVSDLDLLNAEIPADAKLLMISAPSVDYTSAEIAKLDTFFANGGGAFIMFNTSNNTSMPNLESALRTWGIEVSQSVSVEEDMDHTLMISTTGNTLCVPEIAEHSITQPLIDNDRTVAYLPYARTLTQLFETNTSYKTSVLMSTTQSSHTAFDYNNLDAAADTAGSYPIMIASENSMNNSRIVVAGATMMYSVDEQTISTSFGLANYDLLGNIYSYLSGSDDFNITAKSLLSSRLSMTSTGVIVTGLILILIPIVILVYGIVVVYKRKNL